VCNQCTQQHLPVAALNIFSKTTLKVYLRTNSASGIPNECARSFRQMKLSFFHLNQRSFGQASSAKQVLLVTTLSQIFCREMHSQERPLKFWTDSTQNTKKIKFIKSQGTIKKYVGAPY
jgi:hypothetical protein